MQKDRNLWNLTAMRTLHMNQFKQMVGNLMDVGIIGFGDTSTAENLKVSDQVVDEFKDIWISFDHNVLYMI
jgi:hypothetical protein